MDRGGVAERAGGKKESNLGIDYSCPALARMLAKAGGLQLGYERAPGPVGNSSKWAHKK